jgi:hypothetical protein
MTMAMTLFPGSTSDILQVTTTMTLFPWQHLGYTASVIAASHDDDDDNFDSWRREENEEVICSLIATESRQVYSDNCLSFSGLIHLIWFQDYFLIRLWLTWSGLIQVKV